MKNKRIPILDIYTRYHITPNLQRHMFEVAAVGMYIADHWNGSPIDVEQIKQALLLHDLGNIVKFKRPFLGELEKDSAYWEKVQQETMKTYGSVAHDVTEAMVRELHVIQSVQEIIHQMRARDDGSTAATSWEAKIADCADFCVSPEGIVGINKRLEDFIKRYELTLNDPIVVAWLNNAKEVRGKTTVDLFSPLASKVLENLEKLQKSNILLEMI